MSLARQLLKLKGPTPPTFATGVVTGTAPFTVQINGDPTDIPAPPRADIYTPALDDVVLIQRTGPTLLVLCKIA